MKKKIPLILLFFSSSLNMLLLSVVKIQTHTWFNIHGAVFYILVSYLGYIIVNKCNNLELRCVKN